jgi:hypothetical protein
MRRLKFSNSYQLIFSLFNADPETLVADWDVKEAIESKIENIMISVLSEVVCRIYCAFSRGIKCYLSI